MYPATILLNELGREPKVVWRTITGERTVVAVIGVFFVILGLELDPPERRLEDERRPPDLLPPLPLASDRTTSRTVMKRRRISVENLMMNHPWLCLLALVMR